MTFQKVFTREDDCNDWEETNTIGNTLDETEISVDEITKMLNELAPRKAHGPDGVSNWVVQE